MAQCTPFRSIRGLAYLPLALVWFLVVSRLLKGRSYFSTKDEGLADAVILCGASMAGGFILLGLSKVTYVLPEMAANGLEPPKWIADYYWAKPSIMIMGFWAAIGSNNMLLYLAGISGISQELYEAADIDGASGLQRFWHATWPQLSNITFFILVMVHTLERDNNWGNWGMILAAFCAVCVEDMAMFRECVKRWKFFIGHLIATDGHLPHEVTRSEGQRGIWYSHFSLMPIPLFMFFLLCVLPFIGDLRHGEICCT